MPVGEELPAEEALVVVAPEVAEDEEPDDGKVADVEEVSAHGRSG